MPPWIFLAWIGLRARIRSSCVVYVRLPLVLHVPHRFRSPSSSPCCIFSSTPRPATCTSPIAAFKHQHGFARAFSIHKLLVWRRRRLRPPAPCDSPVAAPSASVLYVESTYTHVGFLYTPSAGRVCSCMPLSWG